MYLLLGTEVNIHKLDEDIDVTHKHYLLYNNEEITQKY